MYNGWVVTQISCQPPRQLCLIACSDMLNHQRVHSFQAKTLSNGIQQVKGCILERWHVHCSYLITNYLWYILVNDAHTFYLPASKITFFQSFFQLPTQRHGRKSSQIPGRSFSLFCSSAARFASVGCARSAFCERFFHCFPGRLGGNP